MENRLSRSVVSQSSHGTQQVLPPPSSIVARVPQHTGDFVLEFSPDGMLAVVAMGKDNTVMVLDLRSSVPWLTIDTGMSVCSLRVTRDSVAVVGTQEVMIWNLPAEDCLPDTWVGPQDGTLPVNFSGGLREVVGAVIFSDFNCIVFAMAGSPGSQGLHVYHTSTGEHLRSGLTVSTYHGSLRTDVASGVEPIQLLFHL